MKEIIVGIMLKEVVAGVLLKDIIGAATLIAALILLFQTHEIKKEIDRNEKESPNTYDYCDDHGKRKWRDNELREKLAQQRKLTMFFVAVACAVYGLF